MDTFLSDLLNLGAIVRTVIIGLVFIFVTRAVNRYLSHRSVKSIERRIKYAEERKFLIDNLATSDRFILLFSFLNLFGVLMMLSLFFIIEPLLSLSEGNITFMNLMSIMIWLVPGLMSFSAMYVLNKVYNYAEYSETINQKIAALKTRLSKLIGSV